MPVASPGLPGASPALPGASPGLLGEIPDEPVGPPVRPRAGVALALGSGGARGFAHIVLLEALDDLGIRPVAIAGSSMGAILGAAYAAGYPARDLRVHLLQTLRRRRDVMARLLEARVGRFAEWFTRGLANNPVLLDAEVLLGLFWPPDMPARFDGLQLDLLVVTTDYFGRSELVLTTGDLRSAVAGSMAIPGLIKPVRREGLTLVDGGAVNPLPCDLVAGPGRIVIGSDVSTGPVSAGPAGPSPFEAMFGTAQIMQIAITAKMLKACPPDILVRPPIDGFRALDFFRFSQILRAAEALKDPLKRDLEAALERAAQASAD